MATSTTPEQSTGPRSGLDLSWLDPTVRPQDDLYEHVSGRWLREHEIPADRATDGAFRALHDQAERDVRAIIEEAASSSAAVPGSPEQRIGDLYASFLDEDAVEAAGTDPVRPLLREVAAAPDRTALAALLGRRDAQRWLDRHPSFWCADAAHDFDVDASAVASLREREALDEWRHLRRR